MNTYQIKKALKLMEEEKALNTKASEERYKKMLYYFENHEKLDGAFGCIEELASHTTKSRIDTVRTQNENDTYIKIKVDEKIKYYRAEVKTNGGRVSYLYNNNGDTDFTIYTLCVYNSMLKCNYTPIVIPNAYFKKILEEYKALKSTNGQYPEIAIQYVKKSFIAFVADYPIKYQRDKVYNIEDFIF